MASKTRSAVAKYGIEHWTITKLCDSYDRIGIARLVVPRFQRMLVWSEAKKKQLISSVKAGFPIGSLLMSLRHNADGQEEYYLVDGLQRSHALAAFRKHPMLFIDDEQLVKSDPPSEPFLAELHIPVDPENVELLRSVLTDWLREQSSFMASDGWSANHLIRRIFEEYQCSVSYETIERLEQSTNAFLERLEQSVNVGDFEIPVIVFKGSIEDLPEIFDRLNSQGTKLNKFEIFAAAWNDRSVSIQDRQLIEAIRDKYRAFASNADVQIEVDPERLGTPQFPFTLFEFFLGLNKLLRKKFPLLFGPLNIRDEMETESAGFNLVAASLRIPFSEMQKQLPEKLPLLLDDFAHRIEKACEEVNAFLKPILAHPGNASKTKLHHAEYQVVLYCALVYQEMWDQDGKIRPTWRKARNTLSRTLTMHYLLDILGDAWAGHGDSRLRELLLQRRTELFEAPMASTWQLTLDKWFDVQMSRRENKSTRIDSTSVLFLKYLYVHAQTYFEALAETYDGEHLIPKNRLKGIIKRDQISDGLPISNIANLSFLKMAKNRGKRDRTLLENLHGLPMYCKATPSEKRGMEKDIAKGALLRKVEDLNFDPNDDDCGLTEEWFRSFCKKRFEYLKELFFVQYNIAP